MFKQPPPAPTVSAVGLCPTIVKISRAPRHWKFTIAPPDHTQFSIGRQMITSHCNIPTLMDGWMTCDFMSFLTIVQSYMNDGWVMIKGCVCNRNSFLISKFLTYYTQNATIFAEKKLLTTCHNTHHYNLFYGNCKT